MQSDWKRHRSIAELWCFQTRFSMALSLVGIHTSGVRLRKPRATWYLWFGCVFGWLDSLCRCIMKNDLHGWDRSLFIIASLCRIGQCRSRFGLGYLSYAPRVHGKIIFEALIDGLSLIQTFMFYDEARSAVNSHGLANSELFVSCGKGSHRAKQHSLNDGFKYRYFILRPRQDAECGLPF